MEVLGWRVGDGCTVLVLGEWLGKDSGCWDDVVGTGVLGRIVGGCWWGLELVWGTGSGGGGL